MSSWLLEEAMGEAWLASVVDAEFWLKQSEELAAEILEDMRSEDDISSKESK